MREEGNGSASTRSATAIAGACSARARARSCTISRSACSRTTCSASARGCNALNVEQLDPAAGFREQRRLVPRPRRHADRDPRGGEILAERESGRQHDHRSAAGRARRPRRGPRRRRCGRGGWRTCCCSAATSAARSTSTATCSACACPTVRATTSPSCTASTAATTTWSRFAKSNGPGLHHLSWDVGSIHEVGLGAMQMADQGLHRRVGHGAARARLQLLPLRARSRGAAIREYSSDIDYIPVDLDWAAADHPGEDASIVWGPNPPADFVAQLRDADEPERHDAAVRRAGHRERTSLVVGAGPVGLVARRSSSGMRGIAVPAGRAQRPRRPQPARQDHQRALPRAPAPLGHRRRAARRPRRSRPTTRPTSCSRRA